MKYIIRRTDAGYQYDIVHYVSEAGGFGSTSLEYMKKWLEKHPPSKDYTFICQSLQFMRLLLKRNNLLLTTDCSYTIEPKINQYE